MLKLINTDEFLEICISSLIMGVLYLVQIFFDILEELLILKMCDKWTNLKLTRIRRKGRQKVLEDEFLYDMYIYIYLVTRMTVRKL